MAIEVIYGNAGYVIYKNVFNLALKIGFKMLNTTIGLMAEWLCTGLQIRRQRFDSASGLHKWVNDPSNTHWA